MEKVTFDKVNNIEVSNYILENQYLKATISELGATLLSLVVKGTALGDVDVALGYTNAQDMLHVSEYMGATIGRCGNRVVKGRYTLNGKEFTLATNDNTNHLHGGNCGFDKRVFFVDHSGSNFVTLRLLSRDGEEGYGGNVDFKVTYTLERDSLHIKYEALSDEDTLFNPTNHTYFNLNGEADGSILDNLLTIYADTFTPIDETLIPLGSCEPVYGPFDFRVEKEIGKDINTVDTQLTLAGGYDHNYCVTAGLIAKARSVNTGILMSVYSDRCGVQFYSGNFLSGNVGKSRYNYRSGFCLETQCYPNAINIPNFGDNPVLSKGQLFESTTTYRFQLTK